GAWRAGRRGDLARHRPPAGAGGRMAARGRAAEAARARDPALPRLRSRAAGGRPPDGRGGAGPAGPGGGGRGLRGVPWVRVRDTGQGMATLPPDLDELSSRFDSLRGAL